MHCWRTQTRPIWLRSEEPRSAFTLVELLTVISIIGVVMTLILPAVQGAREAARRLQCGSGMRQMGVALMNFELAHKSFPAGAKTSPNLRPEERFFWSGAILPYIEQTTLRASIDPNQSWYISGVPNHPNSKALQITLPLFRCPSANAPARHNHVVSSRVPATYLACASGLTGRESGPGPLVSDPEVDGIFYVDSQTRQADILDGTSTTILIGEALFLTTIHGRTASNLDFNNVPQQFDHWSIGSPQSGDNEASEALASTANRINSWLIKSSFVEDVELSFSSRHVGGAHVLHADGHLQFVDQNIDRESWSALGTRGQLDSVQLE